MRTKSIRTRDPKDSSGSIRWSLHGAEDLSEAIAYCRPRKFNRVNLTAVQNPCLWILREMWTRREISQNTSSFLPAIDRSSDSIRPEARTQAAQKSERPESERSEIRKDVENEGLWTFLPRLLDICVVRKAWLARDGCSKYAYLHFRSEITLYFSISKISIISHASFPCVVIASAWIRARERYAFLSDLDDLFHRAFSNSH